MSMSSKMTCWGSSTSILPSWSWDYYVGDLDPKFFYLRWDRNSIGLGDYSCYLRDGGDKLVNSLDDVEIGIVAGIISIIMGVHVL